jgi:hypothetical protein
MVQNDPAKKKLWGPKVDEIVFLLGIPVYIHFARIKRQERVGIKARGWLQWNRNTSENRSDSMFLGICEPQYNGI